MHNHMRQRDWAQKTYLTSPSQSRTWLRRDLDILLVVLTVFAWAYMIFFSHLFLIQHINIQGLNRIAINDIEALVQEQLHTERLSLLSQQNIFLLDRAALKAKLSATFPLQSIKIVRRLPDTLSVRIQEKVSHIVWTHADQAWLMDLTGTLFQELQPQEQATFIKDQRLPVVTDESPQGPNTGTVRIPPQALASLITLAESLSEAIGEPWKKIIWTQDKQGEVKVIVDKGWAIYGKLDENSMPQQLQYLSAFLAHSIKNTSSLQYIDLRFGEKIFYKD